MKIRKAIVPMAGLGTRLFPASQVCKKELFPVVGPDQIVRSLLHHQLRDLVRDGFDEIGVIVRPGEEAIVRDYFAAPDADYLERLQAYPELLEEIPEMASILDCVTFIVQWSQEGFGHAVYQARNFADDEPLLLVTGDLLYRGPCRTELIDAYERSGGRSVSGVCRIGPSQLHGYGTIHGTRFEADPRLIKIEHLVEKPSLEVARADLRFDDLPEDTWLGWFGLHALSPAIFDVLEELIRDEIRVGGEIQMTHAQDILRQRAGYLALEMTGSERFDFGLPSMLAASMTAYAKE